MQLLMEKLGAKPTDFVSRKRHVEIHALEEKGTVENQAGLFALAMGMMVYVCQEGVVRMVLGYVYVNICMPLLCIEITVCTFAY